MIYYKEFSGRVRVIMFILLINAAACATGQAVDDSAKGDIKPLFTENGNADVVKNVDIKKYTDLLVNIRSYSTNGGYYQNKHEKSLLSMAGEIIEGQDLEISKESIGFYYDKKSARTDRLFLGVDINIEKEGSLDYGRFSVKLIKENVSGIVDLMFKYKALFSEEEVFGIVIGFKWFENGSGQQVNIWIKKDDLRLFYDSKITLNEMYQRSTITNTIGKIILLPI
ncbi:MAG: hypothetical protein CVV49_13900 [Spirochaetae bacterium HGW-Spirochaetae-5]|nr:MAG: hypothetical protein CVV49_13900 [Spirochaetae bacterium HGW-Spirochaetae-5]